MAREITYRLDDPGYTIYHRAALGGLAATISAWGASPPDGIEAAVERHLVRLSWGDVSDDEAIRRILAASFRVTEDKLIDLVGHRIPAGREDLRLAIHTGLLGTFLQHPKMRPGEKLPRTIELRGADDEHGQLLSYKAVNSYAHQSAQGTNLLAPAGKSRKDGGVPTPAVAAIPQSVIPGAMTGAAPLECAAEQSLLLLYLVTGCAVFILRSRSSTERAQYCLVVPDVVDLVAFARALHRLAAQGARRRGFINTYLGRVVGGAEEGALRFLCDLDTGDLAREPSVSGCQAIAMGKVAWDGNQINRSASLRLRADYPEIGVFRAALPLGGGRFLNNKKGESFAVPVSPIPELVAANLARDRHWCANLQSLVAKQADFKRLRFHKGGLVAMKNAVRDEDDRAIIGVFHDAWRRTMGAFGERASRGDALFERLVEVEQERMRNAILRAKTSDALAAWFLRFCADATRGGSLGALRVDTDRLRRFIFNPRNFERFQNLCLFALVSYSSDESRASTGGDN